MDAAAVAVFVGASALWLWRRGGQVGRVGRVGRVGWVGWIGWVEVGRSRESVCTRPYLPHPPYLP